MEFEEVRDLSIWSFSSWSGLAIGLNSAGSRKNVQLEECVLERTALRYLAPMNLDIALVHL